MNIGVDVDDVCIDLVGAWLQKYNKDYLDSVSLDQITTWEIYNHIKPECGTKIYDYLKDPTLYDNAQTISGAVEGVNALRALGHRVIFVTSCVRGPMIDAKWGYLINAGFLKDERLETNFITASDKTLIAVDAMLDDKPSTVKEFGIKGYLFKRPWNTGYWNWDNFVKAMTASERNRICL